VKNINMELNDRKCKNLWKKNSVQDVAGQWNNIKTCLLHTMSDCVGKVEKIARKPWITKEMISKMDKVKLSLCLTN
jgi:hypothetical protein